MWLGALRSFKHSCGRSVVEGDPCACEFCFTCGGHMPSGQCDCAPDYDEADEALDDWLNEKS